MLALREQFDVMLIDSPPMMEFTDATLLASYTDASIVVAQAGKTSAASLSACVGELASASAQVLGVVLVG